MYDADLDLAKLVIGKGYLARVGAALETIRDANIDAFVDLLSEVKARGNQVFVIGNGGSAMTASHMAVDLGVGSQRFGAGIRVVSLVDNSAVVTATGNDQAFEEIFAAQIQLLASAGDVLVAISASGNSQNLVRATLLAKEMGLRIVSLTAFSGGQLRDLADISIHVETEPGDYGPAEDAHLVINHMVTERIRSKLGFKSDVRNLHG